MPMIKVSTYENDAQGIDFSKMPSVMNEGHTWLLQAKPYYNDSKIIKNVADRYLQELNERAVGAKPQAKAKTDNEAQDAIEFLEIILESATGKEKTEIKEAIEFIKLLS